MAGFSYGAAVGTGFRILARRPWLILAWAAAYLVLVALPIWALLSQVLPALLGFYRDTMQGHPHPQDAFAVQSRMFAYQPLFFVVNIVSRAILIGAVFRAALYPEDSRFAYLRLSSRELWLGLTYLVYVVIAVVLILTLTIPLGIAAGIGAAAAAQGHGNPAALYALIAIYLVGLGLIVWVMLRLSLALPMSFAERRFRLYESWSLTRGHALKMFAVGLTVLVLILAVDIAGTFGVWALILNGLSGSASWRAALEGPAADLAHRLAPVIAGVIAVGSLIGMGVYAVAVSPWATIYRELAANVEHPVGVAR